MSFLGAFSELAIEFHWAHDAPFSAVAEELHTLLGVRFFPDAD